MGFSLKKAWNKVRDVYGGPWAWAYNNRDKIQDYLGGPSRYNDGSPPFPESQNPYGPGVQWDENGFPVGPMPRGRYALDYQYEANRRTAARREGLWNDANRSIQMGLDLFQSYRPGGSAALASGLFQSQANAFGIRAQSLEAPDLLIDYRRDAQAKADIEAKRATRINQVIGAAGAVASVVGAVGALSGGSVPPVSANITVPGTQPAAPQTAAATATPGQAPAAVAPAQAAPSQPAATYGGSAAPQQQAGGVAAPAAIQPSMPSPGPAGAGGGGAAPTAVQRDANGNVIQGQNSGGAGMAPGGRFANPNNTGQPIGMGGFGQDGDFTPTAAAASGMRASPMLESVVRTEWAQSRERQQSVSIFAAAARSRLLTALHS